ncbi:PREDICTED: uncharacterized protein LOC105368595 [Ceratosolen solmsi marchali]|uniref:Uncharacterized protein LOC105368595 n=1 Tax=Ceratosolen solmsi marchali TaxID=326594 RepID=A0AAJ6YX18_9HYME|nr:PREDICTED: uncharacterized protein LOC105368595 [Ceratosolen solmsi marchali]
MVAPGTALLVLLLAALLALSARAQTQTQLQRWLAGCPSLCACDTQLRASCTGRRLYSIHAGVSSAAQALDLSNNSVASLEDRQLSRAGLTRLKYLNLSMNAISEIGLNAFDDLRNLTVLDLSMNRIDYIAPDTFYYNQKLQILHLAGNKFNLHVPSLHSVSLVTLDLSGCRINHLPKHTFQGLKQLRKLDLSSNAMTGLDKDVLRQMPFLQKLSLGRNNWICDESMYSLKLYTRSRNIETHPICNKSALTIKFEKISIGQEAGKGESRPSKKSSDSWDVDPWRKLEEAVQDQEQECEPTVPDPTSIFAFSNGVSPFWFLLIGFLLGSGATMVVTYLWLSTTISCLIPRIRRAGVTDSPDTSSQRVSLLRHLWQQENASGAGGSPSITTMTTTTTTTTTTTNILPICPGTPPPPYREVMLHRNLYPRAAIAAIAAAAAAVAAAATTTTTTTTTQPQRANTRILGIRTAGINGSSTATYNV